MHFHVMQRGISFAQVQVAIISCGKLTVKSLHLVNDTRPNGLNYGVWMHVGASVPVGWFPANTRQRQVAEQPAGALRTDEETDRGPTGTPWSRTSGWNTCTPDSVPWQSARVLQSGCLLRQHNAYFISHRMWSRNCSFTFRLRQVCARNLACGGTCCPRLCSFH